MKSCTQHRMGLTGFGRTYLFLCCSLLVTVTFARELGKDCQCSITGDPHYQTFDGQHITFTGHCKYALVTPKEGSHLDDFRVEVKNMKRGNVKIPYTDRVLITLGKHLIEFLQLSKVMVNGSQTSLPFFGPEFNVTVVGGVMKLMTKDGMLITFDGDQKSHVTLPLCYAGKVRGICGDCNGVEDDYCLKNGSDVSKQANKFALIGESYKVPDENDDDPSCKTDTSDRLKRHSMPFSPYEGIRDLCKNFGSHRPIDELRKVCDLMEHFERTTCEGSRSVFLTCDVPKVRQQRAVEQKEDYYAVDNTHFIKVPESLFFDATVVSVEITPNLYKCLENCVTNVTCMGAVYVMGMTCVQYEAVGNSVSVAPGPGGDAYFKIPDVFGDSFPVMNGSKAFTSDMLLRVPLHKCADICRQCTKCEGLQYHRSGTCVIFMGINKNGPIKPGSDGWTYYSFLDRICSKKCAENARCLMSTSSSSATPKTSNRCMCEPGYIGDGVKECKAI